MTTNMNPPDTSEEQYQRNYTPREKLLHKLTGAAYQATFEDDYELVVDICEMILEYERGSVVPSPADSEALARGADAIEADVVELTTRTWDVATVGEPVDYDRVEHPMIEEVSEDEDEETTEETDTDEETTPAPEDISLPDPDTVVGEILRGLYHGHTSGIEWLTKAQIGERMEGDDGAPNVAAYCDSYHCIQSRNVAGQHANEYQIPSAIRMRTGEAMFGDDDE